MDSERPSDYCVSPHRELTLRAGKGMMNKTFGCFFPARDSLLFSNALMRFRHYVIAALSITALVPFLAWSIFQWQDIAGTLSREDRDQRLFTGVGSAFIIERLKTVEMFADHVDSEVRKALEAGESDGAVDGILKDLTRAHPYLTALRLERRADKDGTDRQDCQWRLEESGGAQALVFKRRLDADPDRQIIGTVDRGKLFRDIAAMFNMRNVRFVLLDESGRIIWPAQGWAGRQLWTHPLRRESGIREADSEFWVTANKFAPGTPSWTMLAIKSQAVRIEQRNALLLRTGMLALLMTLLTILVGYAALRPLTKALKQLRGDLDDQGYASESTTIRNGPIEFKEIQQAYRALRERLAEQNKILETHNSLLTETVDQRSRALAKQERLFGMVLEDIQEGMLLLDENWALQHANPAARKMLPDHALLELVQTCHAKHDKEGGGKILHEFQNSGRTLVFECAVLPFGGSGSEGDRGYCLLFGDVTGRAVVERMKDDLISIVAHELRTPVTACRLQLDLMDEKNGPSAGVDAMRGDLDHLSHIIDDWLAVAKIDGGTYRVEPRVVQLVPLVNKAVRLVRTRYQFGISLDVDEEAECLFADPGAFVELLVNLLTNACRYAHRGEVPRIEFHARSGDGGILLEVVDYGIGFSPEAGERIFDRFFQLENGTKRRTGGTGLGLVICRAICEAHGGSIMAERVGDRTIFRILLPTVNESATIRA